jgi:UDP-N-acetylmuramoyl-tripeptide--D-alanyl-D-alanine ligase
MAAIAVGLNFAVSPDDICQALEQYKPSNNRSQLTVTAHNRLIVDAYNANPSSMRAALENFAGLNAAKKMVILGDMRELGKSSQKEHQKIADLLSGMELEQAWLVGCEFRAVAPQGARTFADVEEVKTALSTERPEGCTILIKGSNSMKLFELPPIL